MAHTADDLVPSVLRTARDYRRQHNREPGTLVLADDDWDTMVVASGGNPRTSPRTGTMCGLDASASADVEAGTFLLGGQPHKVYTRGVPNA